MHKWHSNIPKLEISEDAENEDDLSYAKQQLGVKSRECGLLGLKWNKSTDEIAVTIPEEVAQPTKRGILAKVPPWSDRANHLTGKAALPKTPAKRNLPGTHRYLCL